MRAFVMSGSAMRCIDKQRLQREARYLGLGWCLACSLGALLGGLIGWITWAAEDPT